jgi:hypothetical protein
MKRHQLLAALESVRAWLRDQPDDVEPFRLQPIPGLVIQVRDGRSPNAEKCARYRERRTTRVATGVEAPADTMSDTGSTRVATPAQPESRPVSNTESAPPSLGFPLASPSGSLPPSLPKEIAALSEGTDRFSAGELSGAEPRDWSKRPPRNLDDAREMPLEPRAQRVLKNPFDATFLQPEQWPEVRMAVSGYREAVKQPRFRVGQYGTDAGVRRLVELFAAGLTAEEVCEAIPAVVASSWWREGGPKDLGSLSLTVVRRALAERPAAGASDTAALPRPMFGGAK